MNLDLLLSSFVLAWVAWMGPSLCPEYVTPQVMATVSEARLDEVSGIVAGRNQPAFLWVHNDSGDAARCYAIDHRGRLRGQFLLKDTLAVDFEDLAAAELAEGAFIYLGDIGDNRAVRSEIAVYRIAEPTINPDVPLEGGAGIADQIIEQVGVQRLTYEDGSRDAEALLVEPASGDLYVISKRDRFSRLYHLPNPAFDGGLAQLRFVAELPFGGVVAADLSPSGDELLVKTYIGAFLWNIPEAGLGKAFASKPCPLVLAPEPQGEAIGFAAAGRDFFTLSEKQNQPLYFYERK